MRSEAESTRGYKKRLNLTALPVGGLYNPYTLSLTLYTWRLTAIYPSSLTLHPIYFLAKISIIIIIYNKNENYSY